MIEYRDGNLLDQADVEIVMHQCNCFCNMGSGIAKEIRARYPEAYKADMRTKKGDPDKLGTYTEATLDNGRVICNLYGQFTYGYAPGRTEPHTDYDALRSAISEVIIDYVVGNLFHKKQVVFGVPYKIGCGLGGGDWKVVEKMLRDLFEKDDRMKLVICKL